MQACGPLSSYEGALLGSSYFLHLFYIIFSVLTGALSNTEQAKGISFARAIGIVFLLNEIEQLIYYQQLIENVGSDTISSNDINPRIEFINTLFPDTFCVLEKI